jgi:two-component system phosphate regulon response regulator PhoB
MKQATQAQAPHILIVEDDPDIGQLARLALEMAGYSISLGSDAVQAFELLEAVSPDLIILDVMLPETTGFELLAELRNRPALSGVPMMMMSAVSEDAYIAEGHRLGAEYYLKKPFLPSQLVAAVKGVFATASKRRQIAGREN